MTMSMKKGENKKKEKTSPSLVCDFLFGHADKVTNFAPNISNQSCRCIQAFSSWQTTVPLFPLFSFLSFIKQTCQSLSCHYSLPLIDH